MFELILKWTDYEIRNNLDQFRVFDYQDIQIEIGFGKGHFLIQQALQRKDLMYIGFEIKPHCFEQVLVKIERNSLHNILLFNCDGVKFVRELIPNEIIDLIHIYFPQYSTEFKSEKIISSESMHEFDRILKKGSQLRIVTDRKQYFSIAISNLIQRKYHLTDWIPYANVKNGYLINSEWGRKFNSDDEIYYLNAKKRI